MDAKEWSKAVSDRMLECMKEYNKRVEQEEHDHLLDALKYASFNGMVSNTPPDGPGIISKIPHTDQWSVRQVGDSWEVEYMHELAPAPLSIKVDLSCIEENLNDCPDACGGCSCFNHPPCSHCTEGHGMSTQVSEPTGCECGATKCGSNNHSTWCPMCDNKA